MKQQTPGDTPSYTWRLKKMTLPGPSSSRTPLSASKRTYIEGAPIHIDDTEEKSEEDGDEIDEDETLNAEELEDVSRMVDLCKYDYVPYPSEGEAYIPPQQPYLEGLLFPTGKGKEVEDDARTSDIRRSKRKGLILSCRNLPTSLTPSSLATAVEQFRLEGRVILPQTHMRCYHFNHKENGGRPPRMVLTTSLLKLRVSSPLHPFIRKVCEYFKVAPIQIREVTVPTSASKKLGIKKLSM